MKLQQLIAALREWASPASFPFGGVGGAHSYPGPEPGRIGYAPLPEEPPPKLNREPGLDREQVQCPKCKRWLSLDRRRRSRRRQPVGS